MRDTMHSPHSTWNREPRLEPCLLAHSDHPRMESLGAAAAISQFLIQFIATVDLVKKIKGSSQSLKRYREQLEDLRTLCEDISGNPALSTDEVQRETESILQTIGTHKDVSSLLEKGRVYRSIAFVLKEKSFGDLFATLETKKTNLSLRVQNINCLALHDLRLHMTSMSRNALPYGQPFPQSSPTPTMTWQQAQHTHHGLRVSTIHAPQYNNYVTYGSQGPQNTQGAFYRHNTAAHNVQQHVGPVVRGKFLTPASQFSKIESTYEENSKHGAGTQVQGLTYEPPKEPGKVLSFVPTAPGNYFGNKHEGTGPGYGFGECQQVLGTLVID